MIVNKQENDIIILGCGLSGMITALANAYYLRASVVVERRDPHSESFYLDPRTTAITAASKNFLSKIGVWDELKHLVGPIQDIYVVNNKSPNILHFDSLNKGQDEKMGYMIPNNDFLKKLFDLVSKNQYISLVLDSDYDIIKNDKEQLELKIINKATNEARSIQTKLLIICDGKDSKARKYYFSDLISKDYRQKAITFVTKHEYPHEGAAVEHFMPSGPFAILPLADQNRSSVVWSLEEKEAELVASLSKEEFVYLLQDKFGPFLGHVEIVENIWPLRFFSLKASIAKRYYNKSMVLVADSAHVIHPLAGQGLNQGIKDIAELTNLLECNDINDVEVKEHVLIKYEKSRFQDNLNMFGITNGINDIFASRSMLKDILCDTGFKLIESAMPIKSFFVKYAMGKRD